jgi:hypothetical protein
MSTVMTSVVCSVLFAKHAPSYGFNRDRWRWRRLTTSLFDPYRPELHYMRGPGPKWREKHAPGGSSAFPALRNNDRSGAGKGRLRRSRTQAVLIAGTLFLLLVILTYSAWPYWEVRGKVRADVGCL